MELGVAITLMVGLSFLGILGVKVAKSYFSTESHRITENIKSKDNAIIQDLELKLNRVQNVNAQVKFKLRKMRDSYDLDYDDIDYGEDEEKDGEFKLSELAQSIYPKLPPSLAKLIDKEEFQNAIVKSVEKQPDIINTFVDKFLGKGSDQETSDSNNTPTLKEAYL